LPVRFSDAMPLVEDKKMTNLKVIDIKERAGQENGTAIHDPKDQHLLSEEHLLGQLFKGYFNNKMTVLIFLIQAKQHKSEARVVNGVCCFLDDLYHHMLANENQKRFRRVFVWLKRFVQKLPDVKPSQRSRAIDFAQTLYTVFDINLKSETTGAKL